MKITDPKKISFAQDVRDKILSATKTAAKAVGCTMGPGGQLVMIRLPGHLYGRATKDGVTVMRNIFFEDPEETMAALMLIQAANRQLEESGDGTTLTCVLAHHFIKAAYEFAMKPQRTGWFGLGKTEAPDLVRFLDDLERFIGHVIQYLKKDAIPCDTLKKLIPVAEVATNGNQSLGRMIAEAVFQTSPHGQVLCEPSDSHLTRLNYVEGYQFERGIEYAEFITNPANGTFEATKPLVLVTDHDIAWARQLLPLLEKICKAQDYNPNRVLVIFSNNVRDEALSVICKNFVEKKFLSVTIKPSGIGTERKYCLADIAAAAGARYISEESGIRLEDVELRHLGTCSKIRSKKAQTVVVGVKDEKRREFLKATIANSEDPHEKDLAIKSLAKLEGAVAIISVGAHSESEQKEVMDRVDDAIRACKSAMEEGITAGGGVALFKIACRLRSAWGNNVAGTVLVSALESPIRKILENYNKPSDAVIKALAGDATAYDIHNGQPQFTPGLMVKMGIVDAVKVLRTALLNSFSVVKTLVRTNVMITPLEKGKN